MAGTESKEMQAILGTNPLLDLRIDSRAEHEYIPATSTRAPVIGAESGRWKCKLTLFIA